MFDLVRNNKRIVQIFLALICLPFAFFGVESYMNQGSLNDDVARVADVKITRTALDEAMREAEAKQRLNDPNLDSAQFNTAENRRAVLNNLINRQVLMSELNRLKVLVPDETVRQVIAQEESFQENGQFSNERYAMLLAGQGLTPSRFEENVRRDLALQQMVNAFVRSNILNENSAQLLFHLQTDKREVAMHLFKTDSFLKDVHLAEQAVRDFFEKDKQAWRIPARAQIEYVVFSPVFLAEKMSVSEEEIEQWYQTHSAQFVEPEERRASHILIEFDQNKPESKTQAREKIEKIAEQLKKAPKQFAQIAQKESQDWGSQKKGGDLGFFTFDAMEENFSNAAFALEKNQISPIVETEYGFHLILLTDIRAERHKKLDEVRLQITETLRDDKASRFFNEHAEEFVNMVYDQSDSLLPVAEKFNLSVQTTDWLNENQVDLQRYPFLTTELSKRVFSAESVDEKRNTEALDLGNHTLVSARIKTYEAAFVPPFEQVKAKIETRLKNEKAAALAEEKAKESLEKWKKDENALSAEHFSISRFDSVMHESSLSQEVIDAIFNMPVQNLPNFRLVTIPGEGVALLKLKGIQTENALDDITQNAMKTSLKSLYTERDWALWLLSLRDAYALQINEGALVSEN